MVAAADQAGGKAAHGPAAPAALPFSPRPDAVAAFLDALDRSDWSGEMVRDSATLPVWAVDNSVYRVPPAAVVFPRSGEDLACLARLAAEHDVPLTARGGGTGTNGQSLSAGVCVDVSRHMAGIVEFDPQERRVTVQPGVVLDQLNAFLAPHGLFFPPTVSTASRATIGGMVGTDASGKGSRVYGKTSDYVAAMDIVLADGGRCTVTDDDVADDNPRLGPVARTLRAEIGPRRALVDEIFPRMNRTLTGYNLKEALREDGSVCLPKLLAGSEGTLALTAAITLRLLPLPRHRAIGVIAYDNFMVALEDVGTLLDCDPLAIEILDDRILKLAKGDPVWPRLEAILGDLGEAHSLLVVEFAGDSEDEIRERCDALGRLLEGGRTRQTAHRIVRDTAEIADVWGLRAQSVGLLGALEGRRKANAFVEDCAVPPEQLSSFVTGFREILDDHGLEYGMFGHADVGCLHVRPILDMTAAEDRAMIRTVSDRVAHLAAEHGGLLWGEHGRGYRAEFSPLFFGEELYDVLRHIKAAFDPGNRLNPGKLAVPEGRAGEVTPIDVAPFRGAYDAEVTAAHRESFDRAFACNGNAACHHWDQREAMCPSHKVTRDPVQSPKGRAALIREWLHAEDTLPEDDPGRARSEAALSRSLETCLSCRACASSCPVRVDIPAMKARFLDTYYARHRRPLRDRVVRIMEPTTLLMRRLPGAANLLLRSSPALMRRAFGLVDLPKVSAETLEAGMARIGVPRADGGHCEALIVSDSFTGVFGTEVPVAAARLLKAAGVDVRYAPPQANGKALEVRGMSDARARQDARTARWLLALTAQADTLVAVEPVAFREYARHLTSVMSLDGYLDRLRAEGRLPKAAEGRRVRLLPHCTEKTADPASVGRWQRILQAAGHDVEVARVGCCGMAGLFGHETEHRDMSEQIFEASWADPLRDTARLSLATGFSCRDQCARFSEARVAHPVEALLGEPTAPRAR